MLPDVDDAAVDRRVSSARARPSETARACGPSKAPGRRGCRRPNRRRRSFRRWSARRARSPTPIRRAGPCPSRTASAAAPSRDPPPKPRAPGRSPRPARRKRRAPTRPRRPRPGASVRARSPPPGRRDFRPRCRRSRARAARTGELRTGPFVANFHRSPSKAGPAGPGATPVCRLSNRNVAVSAGDVCAAATAAADPSNQTTAAARGRGVRPLRGSHGSTYGRSRARVCAAVRGNRGFVPRRERARSTLRRLLRETAKRPCRPWRRTPGPSLPPPPAEPPAPRPRPRPSRPASRRRRPGRPLRG